MATVTSGVFAGMDTAVLQGLLQQAQTALVELQMGKSIVSLSYTQGDGAKSVTRKMGSVAECTALIMQMQQALGICSRRRPLRFIRT